MLIRIRFLLHLLWPILQYCCYNYIGVTHDAVSRGVMDGTEMSYVMYDEGELSTGNVRIPTNHLHNAC